MVDLVAAPGQRAPASRARRRRPRACRGSRSVDDRPMVSAPRRPASDGRRGAAGGARCGDGVALGGRDAADVVGRALVGQRRLVDVGGGAPPARGPAAPAARAGAATRTPARDPDSARRPTWRGLLPLQRERAAADNAADVATDSSVVARDGVGGARRVRAGTDSRTSRRRRRATRRGGPAGATLVDPVAGAIDGPLEPGGRGRVGFRSPSPGAPGGRRCATAARARSRAVGAARRAVCGRRCYRVRLAGRLPAAVACRVVDRRRAIDDAAAPHCRRA